MKITLADVRSVPVPGRKPGYCVGGIRQFADRYGLDVRAFAREGIDAEILQATGDSMAEYIVQYVRERNGQGH